MNAVIQIGELGSSLRNLATGCSLAVFILIPSGGNVENLRGTANSEPLELVTTLPDGAIDPRIVFYRTHHGLESSIPEIPHLPIIEGEGIAPDEEATDEELDLPVSLKAVSGLPVHTLAGLVGVSRVSYHKWLRGRGVSDEHRARLSALHDDFITLRTLLGSEMSHALETPGPHGTPLDLLRSGARDEAIGLALRRPSSLPAPERVSDEARRASGIGGWLRPVPRLAWSDSTLDAAAMSSRLEELSPRALPEAPTPVLDEDADDGAFLAYRVVIG